MTTNTSIAPSRSDACASVRDTAAFAHANSARLTREGNRSDNGFAEGELDRKSNLQNMHIASSDATR